MGLENSVRFTDLNKLKDNTTSWIGRLSTLKMLTLSQI